MAVLKLLVRFLFVRLLSADVKSFGVCVCNHSFIKIQIEVVISSHTRVSAPCALFGWFDVFGEGSCCFCCHFSVVSLDVAVVSPAVGWLFTCLLCRLERVFAALWIQEEPALKSEQREHQITVARNVEHKTTA